MKTKSLPSQLILLLLVSLSYTFSFAQAPPVKQWDKTYGGSSYDLLYSLQQTSDGGYVLGGTSQSGKSGNKNTDSKGGSEYWVVKLMLMAKSNGKGLLVEHIPRISALFSKPQTEDTSLVDLPILSPPRFIVNTGW